MKNSWRGILITLGLAIMLRADYPPSLAAKGIESYRRGQYIQAKILFSQAMEAAVLQAREDWIVKAALNLIDLELDAHNLRSVRDMLDKLPGVTDPELQTAINWKKAQYYFYSGRIKEALAKVKDASRNCAEEFSFCDDITIDLFRIQLDLETMKGKGLTVMKQEVTAFKGRMPKNNKGAVSPVQALIAMKEGDYQRAVSLWSDAVSFNRIKGRYSQMARCLTYLSLSEYMNGDKQSAIETTASAVNVYNGMGLTIMGLRSYALNLFFITDETKLEKIKRRLELIGSSQTHFNLTHVLKDYRKFANLSLPPSLSYLLP